MFAKIIVALVAFVALFGSSQSQVVYPSYAASAYYPSYGVYSPYAYGYAAAAYPSYYGWGSNKGQSSNPSAAPKQSLTNNQ